MFWVKELAIVYLAAFFPYPLLVWEVRLKWLWVIAGGIAMLLGHFLLMYWIAGDPLHLITIVTSAVDTNFIQGQQGEDGAWYYFRYLFFDIKHTALVPFLAVFGMVLWAWRRQAQQRMRSDGYIVYWMCALIFVLSFTVVSVDPLRLIMKQSNYLNLFIAPIALFAGYFLWRIQLRYALFLLSIALPLGVGLSALEQQAYRVFTSNSQAAVQYAREHPHDYFLGSVNNANLASIHAILDQDPDLDLRFNYLLRTDAPDYAEQLEGIEAPYVYVVLDRETQFWGAKGFTIEQVPECWQSVTNLEPQGFGAGQWVVRLGLNLAHWLPDAVGARVQGALQPLAKPKLATVYRVERQRIWCQ